MAKSKSGSGVHVLVNEQTDPLVTATTQMNEDIVNEIRI